MAEDIIKMSQKELGRLHVIKKVLEGSLRQVEAGEILCLSPRQVRRLARRVRLFGDIGIAHKLRGRCSSKRFPERLRYKAVKLYQQRYTGFGPTLAAEKMKEINGIKVSDETLRKWLIESGDWKKGRRKRVHRKWRERKHHFGEMVQIDGSHHAWLEERGPLLVLMGYIDDATNNTYGRFYDYEGTIPAMESFKGYIRRYGLPQSVYFDRHTTYKSTAKPTIEDDLAGREPMSQFERALKELGITVIHAASPQAKGRIERLFRTLQDRLVKEMRIRGISTKEEANRFIASYLSRHNKRFGKQAAMEGDLHRPIPEGLLLDNILCIKTKRALRNDFTIAHNKRLYQILEPVNAKCVVVFEHTDGRMLIKHNDRVLRFKEISIRPLKLKEKPLKCLKIKTKKIRKKYIPPKDHPWRKYSISTISIRKEIPLTLQE